MQIENSKDFNLQVSFSNNAYFSIRTHKQAVKTTTFGKFPETSMQPILCYVFELQCYNIKMYWNIIIVHYIVLIFRVPLQFF